MDRPTRRPTTDALLQASPSETTPFLLTLARRQAASRTTSSLTTQWERDPFVAPSALDQRVLHALDGAALAAAPDFEAMKLSPVAPLGVCSAVAPTSQDRTLTANRGTEVVSDPTNVLALECARRLQKSPDECVRLCTVHQTLRAQPVRKTPGFSQHFRLFVLVQAGRGLAEDGFETCAFAEHAAVFERMLAAAAELGCRFGERRGRLRTGSAHQTLGARVHDALRAAIPDVPIVDEALDAPYYDGLRFLLEVRAPGGEAFLPLADTGRFDWVARLTSNRKLRFVASGIGIQLFDSVFRVH